LGSGPSCYLAVRTGQSKKQGTEQTTNDGPVGGLILHAPFLSVYRVVIDTGCTLFGDKFPNMDLLPMARTPTLLIHGKSDQIVPFRHSERLYDVLPPQYRAKPLYIEGMSHNNVHTQVRHLFVDKVTEYLEDHVWPQAKMRRRTPPSRLTQTVSSSSPSLRPRNAKIQRNDQKNDLPFGDEEEGEATTVTLSPHSPIDETTRILKSIRS
jgi:hypothetical protein